MSYPVYFDFNATTPCEKSILEAMLPYLKEDFGNPACNHPYGWKAEVAVEKSRSRVAKLVGGSANDIYFTSGATESNNWVVLGVGYANIGKPCHIITSQVEHKAILAPCKHLEKVGVETTYLPVDKFGRVNPQDVKNAIRPDTKLISLLFANNEIGSLNPIKEIGGIARNAGVPFHTDAAQAAGKAVIDVEEMNIDMLSLSAHKIYGPKGVGALYKRENINLTPLFFGGGQEKDQRPGTLNVPGIVAIGKACELSVKSLENLNKYIQMRDHLISEISGLPGSHLNGHPTERIYSNVSFSFEDSPAIPLQKAMGQYAVSTGSACSTGQAAPSHVLKAIGHSDALARATLRFGIGRCTTMDNVMDLAKFIHKTFS